MKSSSQVPRALESRKYYHSRTTQRSIGQEGKRIPQRIGNADRRRTARGTRDSRSANSAKREKNQAKERVLKEKRAKIKTFQGLPPI
ncbi:hypothetical protein BDZ97DRAFT_832799 [Flammula alnicola]|nr:hypothetical protein BDZ97DRAFT_832799 [Flammula alnicola]